MNAIEELLSEEVRRYEHLYNPSMAGYKDAQMASNSWREISSNVVLAVDLCLKMWRKLRDKYVREKKAILLPFFIAFLVGLHFAKTQTGPPYFVCTVVTCLLPPSRSRGSSGCPRDAAVQV
ncbi:hypothetical protein EYF80_009284 [Liparis tanakae]|uniref:MADF domain-containing protein n=1 Tax=Liparis tanakae TaxID=230148 RepID=A0A4Z2IRP2_9TELE|nr:hypothetical protein EYF80_009284 [Liparis tanakae]